MLPTKKDFYLSERGLAAYFEKDWADHLRAPASGEPLFEFSPFALDRIQSPYHQEFADLIARAARSIAAKPRTYFEIGAALGRTFYESCRAIDSLKSASLVEPSMLLYNGFQKIFFGEPTAKFSVIKGFCETPVEMDTAAIRAVCGHLEIQHSPLTFQDLGPARRQFDLVVCSNVIDQCKDPLDLVDLLKDSTARGGLLALSCTYQWQSKYVGNAARQIRNINDLFGEGWRKLGEADLPFQTRVNERYWMAFLSHAVIYQKI